MGGLSRHSPKIIMQARINRIKLGGEKEKVIRNDMGAILQKATALLP